jgi:hypothetical protein
MCGDHLFFVKVFHSKGLLHNGPQIQEGFKVKIIMKESGLDKALMEEK